MDPNLCHDPVFIRFSDLVPYGLSAESVQAGEAAVAADFCRAAEMAGRPISMVVVDDEPIYQNWLVKQLALRGEVSRWVVPTAVGSVSEFRALPDWAGRDLFIVDIDLAGESGLELTKEIRNKAQRAIIVVHSNAVDPDSIRAARAAGADAFLPKPMSATHFLRTLFMVLAGRQDRARGAS